jgi:hypothetical protein
MVRLPVCFTARYLIDHVLKDEFRQAQSRVKAELRGMIEMTVQFTRPHQLTVQQRTTHKGHFVQLKDLLSHLQSMDLLADYLERFVSNILIPEFIQPILSGSFTIQLHSTVYSSTCKLVAAPQPQGTQIYYWFNPMPVNVIA